MILEDDLRKEEDILLVEDDLGDPVNLHDDHHGHGDQEHIRRMVYLTKGVSSSLLLVRMNTMGASLNKYFVQSRRLEVESVDKEVWDNITSQKGGQTVRDAKGVKEQHLDDKEAVVRNRNKTVGQIVEEEAAVQLAPSMGTLEQHT